MAFPATTAWADRVTPGDLGFLLSHRVSRPPPAPSAPEKAAHAFSARSFPSPASSRPGLLPSGLPKRLLTETEDLGRARALRHKACSSLILGRRRGTPGLDRDSASRHWIVVRAFGVAA